jgi:hypothetical protein
MAKVRLLLYSDSKLILQLYPVFSPAKLVFLGLNKKTCFNLKLSLRKKYGYLKNEELLKSLLNSFLNKKR